MVRRDGGGKGDVSRREKRFYSLFYDLYLCPQTSLGCVYKTPNLTMFILVSLTDMGTVGLFSKQSKWY